MNRKKTKTMKITTSTMNEEECGVWLDTEQLRMKKQQKKQMRPILKLLNPLARSGGYSTGVSLSFTQTKHPMPPTRQSTISAFFAPRSKEADVHATEIGSTSPIGAYTGRKRKHEMEFVVPEEQNQEVNESTPENRREEKVNSETGGKVHDAKDCDKEQQFFHLIGGYQSDEEEPPAEKRRTLENCSLLRTSETEKTFGSMSNVRMNYWSSSQKLVTEHHLMEDEGDACAILFTQDSEGFRVIAHRGNQSRSPLKDQTNVTACRTYRNVLPTPSPPEMKGESDSEPEMVFTQDSEGNVVIKH
ncbi:aurora kinase A and ninein-interacting protein [Chanos chanos]|uniref:Aurora kinase A and ninein-interacting protein n=1 Tax=Chanos chanos TaxID=29144 RepID=A0A6J2WJ45_CHACN|nr:aurora kinase A and ninein-interacting protein [Chanos chanos]